MNMIDNPIFIIGSARSGTVLLGEVLKKHSKIHCLIERPSVFDYASYLALNPSVKREQPERVRDKLRTLYLSAWHTGVWSCRHCSQKCRRVSGVSRWPWSHCHGADAVERYADKSHQHVLNVPIVLESFRQAQFIHVIRDGRDVVSSMVRHSGVLSWFSDTYINSSSEWPQPWFGVENGEHFEAWSHWSMTKKCALRWAAWVREGRRASELVPQDQWLDVRYEQLVSNPLKIGKEIFSFLNVDFEAETVSHIRSTSVGKWKKRLNPTEIDEMLSIIETEVCDLGYSV